MESNVRFAIVRALFFCLVALHHTVLIILLWVGLAVRSGGLFQAIPMGANGVALLIIAIFLMHKAVYRNADVTNANSLITFGCLFTISLGNTIVFLIRARSHGSTSLCLDFSGVSNSCSYASAVVAISCCSTFLAIIGFIFSYIEYHPEVTRVTPFVSQQPHGRLPPVVLDDDSIGKCTISSRDSQDGPEIWTTIPLDHA
ncbi:hypothetical protein BD779DRAFT_1200535 [Infundibulicybe gibba]|nr:hypothetical protein BD779DRAFT_1200535 [Infundibulicybe gibba]